MRTAPQRQKSFFKKCLIARAVSHPLWKRCRWRSRTKAANQRMKRRMRRMRKFKQTFRWRTHQHFQRLRDQWLLRYQFHNDVNPLKQSSRRAFQSTWFPKEWEEWWRPRFANGGTGPARHQRAAFLFPSWATQKSWENQGIFTVLWTEPQRIHFVSFNDAVSWTARPSCRLSIVMEYARSTWVQGIQRHCGW